MGLTGFKQHDKTFSFMYRGKVEDNLDSSQLGRIKVRVYPMFAGVEDITTLPWATPAMGLNVGAGDAFGTFCVPDIGSMVWIFFEMGDVYQPVYFAEATDGLKGMPTARVSGTTPEDYPLVRVMRTQNGIQIKINDYNDTTDHRDIRVDHPSGSWVEFYPDGRVTVHTTTAKGTMLLETDLADINVLAKKGDINVEATVGDVNVVAGKDITATAGNDVTIEAAHNVGVHAGNNLTVVGDNLTDIHFKGAADLHGDADITVRSATSVNINP